MIRNLDKTFISGGNLPQILNALDEGIHIVDKEGRTIFYNRKVSEIDGLEPEEVMGRNLFEAYPSLTLETSTLMTTIKKGKAIDNIQQSFINSRGKKITTINKTVPIRVDNRVVGAMEISRDITQIEELVENINSLRNSLSNNVLESGRRVRDRKNENNTVYTFRDIIGESRGFKDKLQSAMKAAGTSSSVLLVGETGTGKELFAQSIHNASPRKSHPFIAQNCAALPKDLLEGLLFGTERGGFTGAKSTTGLFEQADGGTILLDEVNSMDLALQAKILRILQDNRVRRIGGQKEILVDVRIIATMNTPPDQAFQKNLLREDLFYRLSVIYLEIPPLRERPEDIPLLTEYFIEHYNQKFSKQIRGIDGELKEIFRLYEWPGNVREIKHVIESAFNMLEGDSLITAEDLPVYIKERISKKTPIFEGQESGRVDLLASLPETVSQIEVRMINKALEKNNGNISAAARDLNISRQSLQYKLKKYGIDSGTV